MTTLTFQSAIVVLLILLNGLFSMSETALVSSRKASLKQRADAGDNGARSALELANSPNRFLSTVRIGISLIGVLSGAVGGAAIGEPLAGVLASAVPGLAPYAGVITFGVVVRSITYLTLILGELVPKRLALNGAETVASRVAGPMRSLSTLASPAVWFLGVSTDAALRLLRVRPSAESPVSEREVEILLEEGARAGVFENEERDLARRALRLDDRPVRALMTPRPKVVWLDADDPPEEHRRLIVKSRHSHYPVARGDLDDLVGVASIKDAVAQEIQEGWPSGMLGFLRRPPLLSEGVPATEALAAFKRSGLPLALVVDERGDIEGLVTPTDVLEALVGDLEEHQQAPVVQRGDGSWLVDGLMNAEELQRTFGLRGLPEEEGDYQTVGGMVMSHLGRVPTPGDRFEWEGFFFEVVDMDGHRVDKVLVTRGESSARLIRACIVHAHRPFWPRVGVWISDNVAGVVERGAPTKRRSCPSIPAGSGPVASSHAFTRNYAGPSKASSEASAKTCSPRRSEISSHTLMPRTLLPCRSSPGEKTPMPSLPGTTARMPPLTPLLAGMPIWYAHCPAKSYIPHVYITLKTSLT
jgi:putative hemolysin